MSGLEHMRARLAECEALIGLMGGGKAAPAILVVRAAAWRDAIEAVAADYAAAEPEEEETEAAEEEEAGEAEEEEAEATGEADEDEPDDAVLAPASAIRAWAEKHGVAVNRMGFIPASQLAAINAKRAEMDLGPFVVKAS